VSEKTIESFINLHMKGELRKLALPELRQKGEPRQKGPEPRGKLLHMTLIDERQGEVDSRDVPGHGERDLIIGDQHKSALSVIVERKARYVVEGGLLSHDAATVRMSLEHGWGKLDPAVVKSLTCDQGKEMAQDEAWVKRVKMKAYFCHPHLPWEKGTCENTNYLIGDMLEGATDFRVLRGAQVTRVADLLNERPRQTLGFKTPKDQIMQLCAES